MSVYAMADLHGQYDAYMKILDLISFDSSDILYIIGDIIDRREGGIEILKHVMAHKNIILLRGNHEQAMLDSRKDISEMVHWLANNGGDRTWREFTRHSKGEQLAMYKYLEASPMELHIRVNGLLYHLVHAMPSTDNQEKLWGRFSRLEANLYTPAEGYVITGHTPTFFYGENETATEEKMRIFWGKGGLIGIDCGCAFGGVPGCLGCLRLNDKQEFYVDLEDM